MKIFLDNPNMDLSLKDFQEKGSPYLSPTSGSITRSLINRVVICMNIIGYSVEEKLTPVRAGKDSYTGVKKIFTLKKECNASSINQDG